MAPLSPYFLVKNVDLRLLLRYVTTLILMLIASSAHAVRFVSVGQQNPQNNVTAGQSIQYSMTIEGEIDSPTGHVRIFLNTAQSSVEVTTEFSSSDCTLENANGTFFNCNEDLSSAMQMPVSFTWTTPTVGNGMTVVFRSLGCISEDILECETSFTTTVIEQTDGGDVVDNSIGRLTNNQKSVNDAVTSLCSSEAEAVLSVCTAINNVTGSDQAVLLDRIIPDEVVAQGDIAITQSTSQVRNVFHRISTIKNNTSNNGGNAVTFDGLQLRLWNQDLPIDVMMSEWIYGGDKKGGSAGEASDESIVPLGNRWGGFLSGRIEVGERDQTNNETGYDSTVNGLTGGIDYRVSNQLIVGVALGWSDSEIDFSENQGDLEASGLNLSAYGNFYPNEKFYIDWVLSWGTNDYKTTRLINVGAVSAEISGDTQGSQLAISLSAGSDMMYKGLQWVTYSRMDYIKIEIDQYDETGGSALALRLLDQRVASMALVSGINVSKTMSQSKRVLIPSAFVEWEHQFQDDERSIEALFTASNGTTSFTVETDSPDRNYFNIGLSLVAVFTEGRSLFANVEGVVGLDDITRYQYELGGRLEF